jgi:hypothetical protein
LAFHLGRETDHSPPTSVEVKEWVELYLHSPVRLHGVVLREGKHRDNFTFTFLYIHRRVKHSRGHMNLTCSLVS